MASILQAAIAMLVISSVSAQIVNEDNPYCKSVFDFYFVLDRQVLVYINAYYNRATA